MAKKKKLPQIHEFFVEHNGEKYQAHYYVKSDLVTVEAMSKDGVIVESTTHASGSGAVKSQIGGHHTSYFLTRDVESY